MRKLRRKLCIRENFQSWFPGVVMQFSGPTKWLVVLRMRTYNLISPSLPKHPPLSERHTSENMASSKLEPYLGSHHSFIHN